jgi:hypothetical protein
VLLGSEVGWEREDVGIVWGGVVDSRLRGGVAGVVLLTWIFRSGKMKVMNFPGENLFTWEVYCGEKLLRVLMGKTQGD